MISDWLHTMDESASRSRVERQGMRETTDAKWAKTVRKSLPTGAAQCQAFDKLSYGNKFVQKSLKTAPTIEALQ